MSEQPTPDWPNVRMAAYFTIGATLFACFVGSLRSLQHLSFAAVSIATVAAFLFAIVGCVPVTIATVASPKDYREVVAILSAIGWAFFSGYSLGQFMLGAAE